MDGGGRYLGGGHVSSEGVQRDLLPIIEGCAVTTKRALRCAAAAAAALCRLLLMGAPSLGSPFLRGAHQLLTTPPPSPLYPPPCHTH